jgi:hypothetical protein
VNWKRASRLAFPSVPEGSRDESTAGNNRTKSELGRLLAAAEGYRVFASGKPIGWVDHVRYERHADHPDEIIVRSRGLLGARRRAVAFEGVGEVRPSERIVVVRTTRSAFERSPLA